MFFNEEESDLKKTKTSENFNKKLSSKKRQFSNDFYDSETMKDFTRFTDIININTFGSQPIVMYKKIKRLQSPIEQIKKVIKKEKKNSATSREKIPKNAMKNYIVDGGLPQKINKYKNKLINQHSQSPVKKINNKIKSKTNRDKIEKKGKTQKAKIKSKEYIPKTTKENNYKQITIKNKNIPNSNNLKKEGKKIDNKDNNKYLTDKNTIEQDEKKKNEYINNLIKNVVTCFKKEYISNKKKNFHNNKIPEKKKDYLKRYEDYENQQENGIVFEDKSEDKTHFQIKKIKPLKKLKIEKINLNNINNINYNLHTDNDKFIYNNLTGSNNHTKSHEFSKILIKSKIMSSNNNEIFDNKNIIPDNKKKNIFKPQINQFEFLDKIRDNFKKIKKLKKEQKDALLNDSFRFSKTNKYKIKNKSPENILYNENDSNKNERENNINDKFLYADRITQRTHTELDKFLKKKKLEKKKEQNEEMKKKQEKIMNTLQNLIRLGEQCKTNNSPHKRADSKNHLKQRKVVNEYYVGTEESKNNTSTFIDKQEYYKSILESKTVLINSKIEKTEANVEDTKLNINNKKNIIISNSTFNNNYQNIRFYNYLEKYIKKNDINIEYNDMQSNIYKDNKLEDLKNKVNNSIRRSNEIFNKENIKRIKSDLSDKNNNNLIKTKFENNYNIKNINSNINNKLNIKNKNNIIDKKLKNKIFNLEQLLNAYIKKLFWNNLKEKYNKEKNALAIMNKKIAFDFLVGICKIYQFKKIQEYNEKLKLSLAIKKLFTPFIHTKFLLFIKKLKYSIVLNNFVFFLNRYLKHKTLFKLLKYFNGIKSLNDKIIQAIKPLENLILKKCIEKIKNSYKNIINDIDLYLNNINNFNSKSYLSKHFEKEDNKANSYIYESLDCEDSISVHPNSVDNDGLHQLKEIIEMQNENRYENRNENGFDDNIEYSLSEHSTLNYIDSFGSKKINSNNSINSLDSYIYFKSQQNQKQEDNQKSQKKENENEIKSDIHLKENLLQQIINNNQTSSEEIRKDHLNEIKKEKIDEDNFIITKINDEKENEEKINKNIVIKEDIKDNNIKKHNKNINNENIINIIENNDEILENNGIIIRDFNEKISKIEDKNKFADNLTEYIISKILLEKEVKAPEARLFPHKTGDFNFQKFNDFNLQSLIKNNSEGNNTLESLISLSSSDYNQNTILEKSLVLQYSISSEFNKTIKERKNSLESNLYNNYIIDKLILLICKEIKQNYSRIYDNISIPYQANYEQVIVASYLQDNELLNNSYKELKVKEDLKNIINKKKIIEKFNSVNKKIRQLKGLEENISFDNIINECILDATIEIINKERPYGESGEPFPFSKREREICFKYNKNDPKPLMKHVYKSLKKMLFEKGNLIKENSPIFDKNDPFLMNIFKKEMESENIWNELEIQEEQVKSIASNVIFDQLINEVIEILEHVQLNRKKPELYQNKSIYACDEIPRLSFQMISSNTDDADADYVSN